MPKILKIILSVLIIILLIIWFFYKEKENPLNDDAPKTALNEAVKGILKKRIDVKNFNISLGIGTILLSPEYLSKYYTKNNYAPVWIGKTGSLSIADSMIAKMKEAMFDGLASSDYHLSDIETLKNTLLLNAAMDKDSIALNKWADLEILLSDAFFTYAKHQYAGRIHSEKFNVEWENHIATIDLLDSLKKASEKNSIRETIDNFSCIYPQYKKLKTLLKSYLERNKNPAAIDSTFNELNIPFEARIEQIMVNMERWKWLPHPIETSYILVNTAGYNLEVIENNESVMDMKIVVGMIKHSTPVFDADMTYLILNPWWEIPMSIAKKEMLAQIKKDTSYFTKNNIKIYKSWKKGARNVPADSINWNTIDTNNFNFRLRQIPGSGNALGQIKFMFPNKYAIYMHDTPNKELFSRSKRTFSHGCIRIEKPIKLAGYLLQKDSLWSNDKLLEAIDSKNEQTIRLPKPIKVFICYSTIWIDKAATPDFKKDIYAIDKELSILK